MTDVEEEGEEGVKGAVPRDDVEEILEGAIGGVDGLVAVAVAVAVAVVLLLFCFSFNFLLLAATPFGILSIKFGFLKFFVFN